MAQGKFAQSEMFKTMKALGEFAVTRVNENGTSCDVLYQGTQERCEAYAAKHGWEDNPLYVEHLESGYRQVIIGKKREATVLSRDRHVYFEGTVQECLDFCDRYPERYFEIWLNDWFNLDALA